MDLSSTLVPSVQELAKKSLTKVPDQYVIPEGESVLASTATSLPQVPVIDLSKLLSIDLKELEKLNYACKEWGFFQMILLALLLANIGVIIYSLQLVNHGISTSLMENMKTKMYSVELKNLAIKVIELMAKALAIDPNEMTEIFIEGTQTMRINYYPPCPQPERVIGLKSHSDVGGLTILLQANDVQGLQIRKDGLWIPVLPLPNAFIINIGDMLEIMTNGIYRSIEHRAIVNSEMERISIATFYGPDLKAILAPAPSFVTLERPAQFKSVSVEDHFKGYFSQELRGKLYLDEVKIQNKSD
ncbi:hypothetical protein RJT34_03885 [Clitoria ternatea]|uniref:Fe2OG dioxygenase domain-containing protein n=1 Tax=Clitoria ternatea TaxID=43366 RepID=A0AAN9KKL3_CLITE